MKRFEKYIVLLVLLIFFGLYSVKAASLSGVDPTNTSGGSIKAGSHNNFEGFRVNVYSSLLKKKAYIDVLVSNVISGSTGANNGFYSTKYESKIDYALGKNGVWTNGRTYYKYSTLDIKGLGTYLLNSTNIDDYFTTTSSGTKLPTENLKKILKKAGYNCLENFDSSSCSVDDYIEIEPLFDLVYSGKDYYGTVYEMSQKFKLCSGFCTGTYNAINSFRAGKEYNINGTKISAGSTNNGYWSSSDRVYIPEQSNASTLMKNEKILGNGMIIYRVGDLVRTYQLTLTNNYKYFLNDKEIESEENEVTISYDIYKNNNEKIKHCSLKNGKSCSIEVAANQQYYIKEISQKNIKYKESTGFESVNENDLKFTVSMGKSNKNVSITNETRLITEEPDTGNLIIRSKVQNPDNSNSYLADDSEEVRKLTNLKYKIHQDDKEDITIYSTSGIIFPQQLLRKSVGLTLEKKYDTIFSVALNKEFIKEFTAGESRLVMMNNNPIYYYDSLQNVSKSFDLYMEEYTSGEIQEVYVYDCEGTNCTKKSPAISKVLGIKYKKISIQRSKNDIYVLVVRKIAGCEGEFESLKNGTNVSMEDRISLFNKYKDPNGHSLNQLLNTKETDAHKACSYTNSKLNLSSDCLEFSVSSENFNTIPSELDLSGYNEILGENSGFCFNSIDFDPLVTFSDDPIVAGKMAVKNDVAAIAKVTKTCYIVDPNYNVPESLGDTSEHLSDVSLKFKNYNTNKDVEYLIEPENKVLNTTSSGKHSFGSIIEYSAIVDYKFKGIYSQYGNTSNIIVLDDEEDIETNSDYKSYRYLGRGVISNFSFGNKNSSAGIYTIGGLNSQNFNAIYYHKLSENYLNNSEKISATCQYKVKKEIIDPELKIQFREVDTTSPFPGKSGNLGESQRKVGTNWRSDEISSNFIFVLNNKTSQVLISNKIGYDLDRNGKIDEIDEKIYNYANNLNDKSAKINGNNYLVKYVMESRNDSKNKTKEGPVYVIDLDPNLINKIRNYNENRKYDDYETLECSFGECISTFLKNYISKPFDKSSASGAEIVDEINAKKDEPIVIIDTPISEPTPEPEPEPEPEPGPEPEPEPGPEPTQDPENSNLGKKLIGTARGNLIKSSGNGFVKGFGIFTFTLSDRGNYSMYLIFDDNIIIEGTNTIDRTFSFDLNSIKQVKTFGGELRIVNNDTNPKEYYSDKVKLVVTKVGLVYNRNLTIYN